MYHIETINNHTFRLRHLPGGIFDMGNERRDESPIHKVELSPFYIGEYLVTQALWKAVMGADNNPSRFIGDRRPVERVSWIDIVEGNQGNNGQPAFLQKLNEWTKTSRPRGYVYRLPTEAEWEYAARGGEPYEYAGSDQLKEVGWFEDNNQQETKAVGLKRPNGFQLYDMSGNVWEWCMDKHSKQFYKKCYEQGVVKNPLHEKGKGRDRVLRGGSWVIDQQYCRLSYRNERRSTLRSLSVGIRLALVPVQR
ncbi:MAG: SUMF1/EgtB/PvdO family nonheme iron enzyme [Bacteroidetes bacterium]|jgi:formylglycine-generating enzyme required for sulfatase activity|nr:SUMF1/EgtB/PvdO family nonheme iron enzyme [Bacteroidota bacterium]